MRRTIRHILLIGLTLLLLSGAERALAQSNNLCPTGSVPSLTVNNCAGVTDYTVAQSFTVDNTANVASATVCVSTANNRRDGWYRFTATSTTSTIEVTVAQGTRNIAVAVYTGTCGAMTEVGCVNNAGNGGTETITLTTTIGTTYYIRLIRINSGSTGNDIDGTIAVRSPLGNDNCGGAIVLTPGAPGAACSSVCGTTFGATGSTPATACSGTADDDVWYSFTATQISHSITVDGTGNFDPVVALLSGGCGALTNQACSDLTGNGGVETLVFNNLVAGQTYFIRVYDYDNGAPSDYEFTICVTTPILPTCPGSMGLGVVNVASLPYSSTGRTTTGRGNEFTASNTIICGNSNYYQSNDEVFVFTPATSGLVSIAVTSGSSNVGIMLYNGCPFIGQGGTCVDYSQSTSGNQFLCVNVVAGNTYYLLVDRNGGTSISSYNITISAPSVGAPPGSTCFNPVVIAALPYTATNQTTQCKLNDYNNSSTGSCMTLYESGEDMVFQFNSTGTQCIRITLSNTSSTAAGFQLYENCPGSAGANCLGAVGGGNVSANFSLPGAGTYYIIVDSWDPPSSVGFDINVTTSPITSFNDLPCNATFLPINTNLNGNNSCSGGTGEPGAPSCWTGGELNTVWFRVQPTGTSLTIKTFLGTLANTQIAVYQGTCSSLTQVSPTGSSCNQDITCGTNSVNNSQVTLTGLTPGNNYWIRVDGENDMTGTFGIIAVDGTNGLPTVYGQECQSPLPVCQNSLSVGNPGYSAFGNSCDFGSFLNCLLSGERASAFYSIPINAAGNLEFDIVPNDWLGAPSTTSTDYDFAIWEVGASGLQCNQLGSTAPVRCNYSALGVTGLSGTGNSPGAYPGFNGAYEPAIAVAPGEVYLLMISNYTNSTSGFTLNFSGVPDPVNYSAVPSSMNWIGGTNTSWGVSGNWGACNIPTCAVDVNIDIGSINQPVVQSNYSVGNVFINAGASLTINPGITLSVCGDFINNGSLVMLPGSQVRFVGSGNQAVVGNFTGANRFANFTMAKPSGLLVLDSDIDIDENDSLLIGGQFDPASHRIRLKKNFYNADGANTHVSPAAGTTYEFNGNAVQVFRNDGSDIVLDTVVMNQAPASSLQLSPSGNSELIVAGRLTLTSGKIVTGTEEVDVINGDNAAVTSGNVNSYVEGKLIRALLPNATGIYDFPVGNAARGYELARLDFTSPTQIPEIEAEFFSWGAVPNGPASSECVYADYSLNPSLNHGYWTLTASSNGNTGVYDITLFNRSYTNAVVGGGWSVMKRSPSGSGPWFLDGTCVLTSTITASTRTGLTGFSDFATVQSSFPLPIELLSFTAKLVGDQVLTQWSTATETNNDYFTVEHSTDGINFESVGVVDGAGNSVHTLTYAYVHEYPVRGVNYYRLKQTDYDGRSGYSDVVAVKVVRAPSGISVYPSPAIQDITLEFYSTRGEAASIQVTDVIGQLVLEEAITLDKGMVSRILPVKMLADGLYTITIYSDHDCWRTTFVKGEARP